MRHSQTTVGRSTCRLRGGITFVELMVVISIIAILSSLFLGALSQAEQTAKSARTSTLVQKLHNILMSRWDSYRSVRLPINADARDGDTFANASNEGQSRFRQDVARRRMLAMRELLRMEMPDRYDDLTFQPSVLCSPSGDPIRPFLWSAYKRRLLSAKLANQDQKDMKDAEFIEHLKVENQDAECLYLIITVGVEDTGTSTEHFLASDFADTDRDGMPEFVDAWGKPIHFLRWAPGFVSPMQPLYRYSQSDPRASVFHATQPRNPDNPTEFVSRWKIELDRRTNTNTSTAKIVNTLIIIDQDDPFNPMRVGPVADAVPGQGWLRSSRWRPGDPGPEHGFLLMPLVYSRGPDAEPGIDHCFENFGYKVKQSPTGSLAGSLAGVYASDPYNQYQASEAGGSRYRGCSLNDGRDFDNIHNQQVSTK